MKNYITDFCEDLNYKNICLYIGYLETDELKNYVRDYSLNPLI